MKDQEYWVTIPKDEFQQAVFNPRAETRTVKGGNLKVWWGYGHLDKHGQDISIKEDKAAIRRKLEENGVTVIRITTR